MLRRRKAFSFERLESRHLLAVAPLASEGFESDLYLVGSSLNGAAPDVPGFTGAWVGPGGVTAVAGSLDYAGFGKAGANRVLLTGSTTLAREIAPDSSDPLANYAGTSGAISQSQSGLPLYVSVLMQVDGTSPPAATFSLYNGGVASTDRVFRFLSSTSNTNFQAIAGPSGTPMDLDPLNAGVNLFVVRIDFAPGSDTISVWHNPVAGQPETTPDAVITDYDLAFDRVAFSRFGGVGSAQFDELRFGDSWNAVTDQNALPLLPRAPISAEGFASQDYAGNAVAGTRSYVTAYDGVWAGDGTASTLAGSLGYPEFGQSGEKRVVLGGNTVLSRELLTTNNGPLANYAGTSGAISQSQSGLPLYVSVLMQVDGTSPPAATFSLYNGGVASTDRVFRFLSSTSNTNFQAIAGPSGTPMDLDPLNAGVNLFVVRIDFAPGSDTISVWHNPVAGQPETTPDAVITDYDLAFDRVAFSRFGGVGSAQFDELRFGDSWNAVTDQNALPLLPGPRGIVGVQEAPPSPLNSGLFPEGFFPFIDEFGQYRHLEWDEKIHRQADLAQAAVDEAFDIAANPSPGDLNAYGGWLAGPQLEATGFFRVEKVHGKWWFVDPDGRLFFSNGITGVSDADREGNPQVAVKTPVSGREDYFAELPLPGDPAEQFLQFETSTVTSGDYQGQRPLAMNFFGSNALAKYGPNWQADSRDIAHERLRSWGMNTIGAWSDEEVYLQGRTAYSMVLFPANPSLINGSSVFPDYFDPTYRTNVENRLLQEAGKSLNDPWNLGYFIHNELSWTRSSTSDIDVGLQTLASAATQPAKIAMRDQLIAKYTTVGDLNAEWLTAYASWNDFLTQRSISPDLTRAEADLLAFDALYADTYYSTTKQAMRAVAPNHLYMGSRLTGGARLSAAQASVLHADVVSINRYGTDISVLPAGLEGDVPLISGEFHYSANDTGLWSDGLRTAANQADRADRFEIYVQSALQSDRFVGVHWLQYWDFPTSGKLNSNNNNSNLGFVTIADTPYQEMVNSARALGANLYETRIGDFAFVTDGVLYVTGSEAADQIQVIAHNDAIEVVRNGVSRQVPLEQLQRVEVSGALAADAVTLSRLSPLPVTVRTDSPGDLVFLTGDYDGSGTVDDFDYELWKASYRGSDLRADGNKDGIIDAADYSVWRDNVGASWSRAPQASSPVSLATDLQLSDSADTTFSQLFYDTRDDPSLDTIRRAVPRAVVTLVVDNPTHALLLLEFASGATPQDASGDLSAEVFRFTTDDHADAQQTTEVFFPGSSEHVFLRMGRLVNIAETSSGIL
ncbi:hypothetical protein [Botrimarina hoheduenensis]|uniref:Beta-galactosidase n=1 Tax=Botrimarina hoheduenensis TaxID=2528000 RepID=A0A5C5VNG1_9BACT|nr:hypothetical protein [Botrimarina hoheduenensis]TWT40118.1 hypothetical protein Pla111_34470 [Botrimarina hoheduenensis]